MNVFSFINCYTDTHLSSLPLISRNCPSIKKQKILAKSIYVHILKMKEVDVTTKMKRKEKIKYH